MPLDPSERRHEFSIDPGKRLVIMRLQGKVCLDSLLATAHTLYEAETYDSTFDIVIDIQTNNWAVDYEQLNTYLDRIRSDPRMLTGYVVIVAATALAYGVGRMYQGSAVDLPSDIDFEPTVEAAIERILRRRAGQ